MIYRYEILKNHNDTIGDIFSTSPLCQQEIDVLKRVFCSRIKPVREASEIVEFSGSESVFSVYAKNRNSITIRIFYSAPNLVAKLHSRYNLANYKLYATRLTAASITT